MKHKITLSTYLVLFLLLIVIVGCKIDDSKVSKPNVVIIFIDDMGYGDISCFGDKTIETPNIDALASNGIKLTNFYVNSPICSPSRVALNTGTYPMRHRIHSYIASSKKNKNRVMANYLDPTVNTIASTLKANGYVTGHFGKWHMGGGRDLGNVPLPTEYGFEKSFVSFEGVGDRLLFPNDNLSKQSSKLGRGKIVWAEKYESTRIYIDSALAFIDRKGDKPFFVNLCPNDVHDPHLPDSRVLEEFVSLTNNPWEQKFFAVLRDLDNQIGRLINSLDKKGLLDNTIIVFTSDNGPTDWGNYYDIDNYPKGYEGELYPPGFTGGFFGRKWSLYEGGIRMPFIMRWDSKIPKSSKDSTSIVTAMDLFPSICSLIGIEYPKNLDGIDKSKSFLGFPIDNKSPVMWEYSSNPGGSIKPGGSWNIDGSLKPKNRSFHSPNLAIRDGDWKLLINTDLTGEMLYNLKTDPGEKINLADKEQEIVKELKYKVIKWRKSMPVEIPKNIQ